MNDDDMTFTERAVLHTYIEGLTRVTNQALLETRPELLADALLSGAAEILRKRYGAEMAAARLRRAAKAIVEQNREVAH